MRLLSDGSPWRPLVHIEDISRAFLAALEADRAAVHNEAFNVGRNEENYRIREVAEIVHRTVEDSAISFAPGAGPDRRSYRRQLRQARRGAAGISAAVDGQIAGAQQMLDALRRHSVTAGGVPEPELSPDRPNQAIDRRWTPRLEPALGELSHR